MQGSGRINTNNSFGSFLRASKKDISVLFLSRNALNQPVVTSAVHNEWGKKKKSSWAAPERSCSATTG